MGVSTWGDANIPQLLQRSALHNRRGMAVSAVAAALLVAIVALNHERAPVWVAAAMPKQILKENDGQLPSTAGSVQATQFDAADDFAAMDEPDAKIEGRQALQQAAADIGAAAHDSSVSISGAEGSDSGTGSSGSSHGRMSKASSAADRTNDGSGTADAGTSPKRGDAHSSVSPGAGNDNGEQETSGNSGSAEVGESDAGLAEAAGSDGADADSSQAAQQSEQRQPDGKGDSHNSGIDSEQGSPSAAEHGSSAPRSESSKMGSSSTSAGSNQDAASSDGSTAGRTASDAGKQGADADSGAGANTEVGSADGQQPSSEPEQQHPARKSKGPIQPELLAAVRAAANKEGAVMLAVTNKDGALFQLPQLLSSMRLVPQEDVSKYLVVVTYSAPAQAACLRQHRHCVQDDFGTGGLGSDGGDGIDEFAGWGSRRFKGITWRKIQLVQDILLQGYAVLSVDLDIVLFKNPLDSNFNPLMNRELDIWMAVDNGKMLNCGFYFVRPTDPADKFMREWLGRFNHEASDDIWEQAEFNQILKGTHATLPELKWEKIDEEWFPDLCFYLEARAVLPDQRQFGELFASTSDKLGNWDKMYGFHAACCKGGGPALPECKRSTATALMQWQIHSQPSEWPLQ